VPLARSLYINLPADAAAAAGTEQYVRRSRVYGDHQYRRPPTARAESDLFTAAPSPPTVNKRIRTSTSKRLPFTAPTLLVWRQEGRPSCKKLRVDLLVVMI